MNLMSINPSQSVIIFFEFFFSCDIQNPASKKRLSVFLLA